MKTPIFDFVKNYNDQNQSRFHMPGHKGVPFLGCEPLDITEIDGADVLYSGDGIINESENNASKLFGSLKTFYSVEGSSLCIKVMLSALSLKFKNPYVLAARNVHRSFIMACALANVDVDWIYPKNYTHLCSCNIDENDLETAIKNAKRIPDAVYLTSPDYLGNIADISAISKVCKKYGILLLVDNAHGSYLKFLKISQHPLDLGADMCCDSAHKTLPVLTGGAYLHISKNCDNDYIDVCRRAFKIHSGTSPSYLILQSLDLCNKYLATSFSQELSNCVYNITALKTRLAENDFAIEKSEPLKIVINAALSGYLGTDLCEQLKKYNVIPEFYDQDFIVLMATPQNKDSDFEKLTNALLSIKAKPFIERVTIKPTYHKRVLSLRDAVFSPQEVVSLADSVGRICGAATVACPPAVPIVVSGERITENDIRIMSSYDITHIDVIK